MGTSVSPCKKALNAATLKATSHVAPRLKGAHKDLHKTAHGQGLTLVHFWAQRKRFLRDRGCACRGCFGGG